MYRKYKSATQRMLNSSTKARLIKIAICLECFLFFRRIFACMIKTLIVDDEFRGRTFLEKLIGKIFSDLEVVGSAATVSEALDIIKNKKPELVFLDVMLNNENGFDLLEQCGEINFEVVFTTAYNDFAVKAFKFNAIDYLLKPIDIDELEKAVEKVKKKLHVNFAASNDVLKSFMQSIKNTANTFDKISIPTTEGFVLVALSSIIYCEAFGNYTQFYLTNNQKIISSYTLKEYDEMLGEHNFFRAHKSHLINLSHVSKYIKGEGGTLVMTNGMEIEVSRRNKEALLKILKS